jgi:hypothetical protein
MPEPSWISRDLLRELTAQAQVAPRKRKNHNFHIDDAAPCQRLLNAVEPESYIPPHCHRDPRKEETLLRELMIRGLVALVEAYTKEQGLFRTDDTPTPAFDNLLDLDLAVVERSADHDCVSDNCRY